MFNIGLDSLTQHHEERIKTNDFVRLEYESWMIDWMSDHKLQQTDASYTQTCEILQKLANESGVDDQGIVWERMRFNRERYRKIRRMQAKSFRTPEMENIKKMSKNKEEENERQLIQNKYFYGHRLTQLDQNVSIGHFQLLRNLKALSSHEIYFATNQGVNYFNFKEPWVESQKVVCENWLLGNYSVFDNFQNFIVLGSHDGNIAIYDTDKQQYVQKKFSLAQGEGMIVNHLQIFQEGKSNNSVNILSSTNDQTVQIHDLESMKVKEIHRFKEAINIAQLSPDGHMLAVYGDCIQAQIYDRRSSKLIANLIGHEDFGFALQWHPNQNLIATGNQDRTCKLWDIRCLRENNSNKSHCYCLQSFEGYQGQISDIKFHDDKLIFAESIDYVHIYDQKTFKLHQEIDIFAEISGIDVFEDKLFIAGHDHMFSCLMEFSTCNSIHKINGENMLVNNNELHL
ncbi:uncharacterized wd repeat-containing [Stylonychia lemnae]|uniref:Uncharacterized wd repeat-containing n=1 Tax=Stylonychia lemnae TaxID=5949 RepID=A0A078AQM6_STYLE|nr:uncharacterized wd repeat-containing [Stylonychia lemnae]|eukprot:CDW83213.1 uncharacterized wd repeat-containing [Stylonychia lemnae]